MQVICPEDIRLGELPLTPTMVSLGGLAEAVHERSLYGADNGKLAGCPTQPPPTSDPRLCVGPPQNLYHLRSVGMCERSCLADPKLQSLHDTGQEEDNYKES